MRNVRALLGVLMVVAILDGFFILSETAMSAIPTLLTTIGYVAIGIGMFRIFQSG